MSATVGTDSVTMATALTMVVVWGADLTCLWCWDYYLAWEYWPFPGLLVKSYTGRTLQCNLSYFDYRYCCNFVVTIYLFF